MALTRWDARRLTVMLLMALATLGDETAEAILDRYGDGSPTGDEPAWAEIGDPSVDGRPARAATVQSRTGTKRADFPHVLPRHEAMKNIGVTMVIRVGRNGSLRHLDVVGGYRAGTYRMVIYRTCNSSELLILRWRRANVVDLREKDRRHYLNPDDLEHFAAVPPGGRFSLAGLSWTRLGANALP